MKAKVLLFSTGVIVSLIGVNTVSAVTYQSNVGVNFTFNPSISLSVSDNLNVDNLTPGNSSDSNIITVGVTTNSVAGYTLSATVGNKTDASTALTNTANSSYTFTNLATTPGVAANLSAFSDNAWGYSYCKDTVTNCGSGGSATWISGSVGADGAAGASVAGYAGLPLDNNDNANERGMGGITLINTTSPADSDSVQFKIGARAGSTQPAGTYTNTINFYAVSYAAPVTLYDSYLAAGKTMYRGYYKLQDMNSSICSATTAEDSELQVIDIRDNKVYWIAKLQDGHCWMTQDLKLDLDSNTTLTHADTDLGWGSDTATTSWTPANSTIQLNSDGKTFPSMGTATTDNNVPKSANLGDWYYAGYSGTGDVLPSTTVNYLTTTNTTYFNTTPYTVNGEHGHIGNYYNWSAAVASNDTSAYTTSTYSDVTTNPQNSVCPAGWRLPTASNASTSTAGSTDEFMRLNYIYNSRATNNSKAVEGSPLFFARGGYVNGSSLINSGNNGYYWSSSVFDSSYAYTLYFFAPSVNNPSSTRVYGRLVRCVAR
ncbi:hypothetical protein IIW29_02005 [Candidatus Saccharibacteria bacterium]|nr:hypothetical protein [Candidatus Saccharibacteria bacterium]